MCVHVMKQKKCHYIGNCSFAHSQEERDVWTYMKNNSCKMLSAVTSVLLKALTIIAFIDMIIIQLHPLKKLLLMTRYRGSLFHFRTWVVDVI